MLKFFRRIRKNLLASNKIGKYLLYAIGEIVLVVLGILIALQMNEWKEEKRAKAYEIKILKENLSQLKDDKKRFDSYLQEIENADKSLHYLVKYMDSANSNTDSLKFHLNGIRIKNFMVYNKSAYESLKSGGLERITNDSLRTALSQLYETYFPGTEIMINQVLTESFRTWESSFRSLFLDGFAIDENNRIRERISTPNKTLIEDPQFGVLIEKTVDILDILRNSYQFYLIPQMNSTIALIEKEIS